MAISSSAAPRLGGELGAARWISMELCPSSGLGTHCALAAAPIAPGSFLEHLVALFSEQKAAARSEGTLAMISCYLFDLRVEHRPWPSLAATY